MSTANNNLRHGMSGHPFYHAWQSMRQRCRTHKNYAGRGISVCGRWQSFEAFREDMWAGWKAGLSLERGDNDGNYEPSNCKWATRTEQNRNKRNSLPKEVWRQLEDNRLTPAHYRNRIRNGWTDEQARSIILGGKR